jgi:hypothetical protein
MMMLEGNSYHLTVCDDGCVMWHRSSHLYHFRPTCGVW